MKIENNLRLDANKLKKLTTIAGLVSVVILGYYVTGVYRNILQIKKLKELKSKPLTEEEL
tara:strand:+ start:723 stop:902 length:180 start_codon:yes stop_codon:yes gene_type:complete